VITFDYRGHHASETPKDPRALNLDGLADDVDAVVGHLGLMRASFWGHSLGGQVLLRLYERRPEIFDSLVLVNGFATNPIEGILGMSFGPSAFELFRKTYQAYPELVGLAWKKAMTSPLAPPLLALPGGFNWRLTSIKDIEVYARGLSSISLDVFIPLFEDMMTYDASGVLPRVQIPTLIIGGAADRVTPLHHQELLKQTIQGSELLIVPYGSHCTQLDFPEFVNLRIDKFLSALRASNQTEASESSPASPPKKAGRPRRHSK
jgi:pimeloyl-ACP methyl ester carboxylesterase